jgi:hypothetical protein
LQIGPGLSPGFIVLSHPPPRSNHRTARRRVERDALIAFGFRAPLPLLAIAGPRQVQREKPSEQLFAVDVCRPTIGG